LGELTGQRLDPSGAHRCAVSHRHRSRLRFGRNVFVNHGCTAMDLGGIAIGDDVMIGPTCS
jgi:acetyltransferase-like isoleucine patch superfamily enzyme